MTVLSPRDAYRMWAPTYSKETAVTIIEDLLVGSLGSSLTGMTLLDAACGNGRRMRAVDAGLAVGVDLTPEMLPADRMDAEHYVAGDIRALPFPDGGFDVVWCRLAIGHVAQLGASYSELARVCCNGGSVIVTDFHPAAASAGHRRTFRDAGGVLHEIEHYAHSREAHVQAARDAGLSLVDERDGIVGEPVRDYYHQCGRAAQYQEQLGLPLVLGLRFARPS